MLLRQLLILLSLLLPLYGAPISQRTQVLSLLDDLLDQVSVAAGLSNPGWNYSLEGGRNLVAYLQPLLNESISAPDSTPRYALSLSEPALELAYHRLDGDRNTPLQRQLKVYMQVLLVDTVAGDTLVNQAFMQSGTDPLSSADLQVLRREPFPVRATGLDQVGHSTPVLSMIISTTSLLLLALLYFVRTG